MDNQNPIEIYGEAHHDYHAEGITDKRDFVASHIHFQIRLRPIGLISPFEEMTKPEIHGVLIKNHKYTQHMNCHGICISGHHLDTVKVTEKR